MSKQARAAARLLSKRFVVDLHLYEACSKSCNERLYAVLRRSVVTVDVRVTARPGQVDLIESTHCFVHQVVRRQQSSLDRPAGGADALDDQIAPRGDLAGSGTGAERSSSAGSSQNSCSPG